MKEILMTIFLSLIFVFGSFSNVYACTGIYVGKKVSKNGSTIVARTEDISSAHPKSIIIYPRENFESGSMYKSEITDFQYPNPSHTYKYYAVADSDGNNDDGIYDSVGFNEFGLSVSATVSAEVREEINNLDPLVENGLREADIATLILSRCKTAKEGIELIAKIVDEKGSAEGNIIMIADKGETWYMELLSGHQYAAIKLEEDVAAIIPNSFMLDFINLNDEKNTIISKDLINLPEKNNLLQYKNNKFSISKTYAPDLVDENKVRLWGGQYFLAPEKSKDYKNDLELFFKPDKKVSIEDVMELQKYRYEDTDKYVDLDKNKQLEQPIRPIGIETQAECHILEIRDDFPKEAPGILWLSLGNAEHNIYLPYFPTVNKIEDVYSNRYHDFNENQAYWIFRGQATLAELNREKYGKNIRRFWTNYQEKLLREQEVKNNVFIDLYSVDKNKAIEFSNEEASRIGTEAYNKARKIYQELFRYIASEGGRVSEEDFIPSEMLFNYN